MTQSAENDAALWDHAPRTYAEQRALLDDSLRNIPPYDERDIPPGNGDTDG